MIDFVKKANGMVSYCVEADTKADATKILELQMRIKELEDEIVYLREQIGDLEYKNNVLLDQRCEWQKYAKLLLDSL